MDSDYKVPQQTSITTSHMQDMNRYESFNVDAALEEMIRFRGQNE